MTHRTDHHPHRRPPKDVDYTVQKEAANCLWCRWADGHDHVTCTNPVYQTGASRRSFGVFVTRAQNDSGNCNLYSPTKLTRLMRALRLGRAPQMRPEWIPDDD